ncbi:hypothetical protein AGMMS49546_23470 [Spirochaetia bacterium]|nr:hypothetical protein AGMMS49546_23470 [Spirochaetia bacterium]
MKNYKVILGIAALALVFGLVLTGCPTQVEGNVGVNWAAPAQVGEITVTKTGNSRYYIVSFDAVHDAKGYQVYLKADGEGKQSIRQFTDASADYKYDTATGAQQINDNPEKWYLRIASLPQAVGSYRIGVVTIPVRDGPNNADTRLSDVKWTETAPITLTPGSAVTLGAITPATKTLSPPTPVTINIGGVSLNTTENWYSGQYTIFIDGTPSTTGNFGNGAASISFTPSSAGTYKVRFRLYNGSNRTDYSSQNDITIVTPEIWTSEFVVTNF